MEKNLQVSEDQIKEVIVDFKKALEENQNHSENKGKIYFQLGLAYYDLYKCEKNPEEKSVSLDEYLKSFKEAVNSSYYDVEVLNKILNEIRNFFNCTFEKGFLLYHLKRYKDAIAAFEEPKTEEDTKRVINSGNLYYEFSHGITKSRLDEEDAENLYYKGLSLYELKDYNKSYEKFGKLIENFENKDLKITKIVASSWYFKGIIYKELHQNESNKQKSTELLGKALEKYDYCIKKYNNFDQYYEKALVLDELQRYEEAIKSLDEFLKRKPQDAKAWLKKGTILFKLANNEEAKSALEKSIKYFGILTEGNPKNPDHWYNKGVTHSNLAEVLKKLRKHQDSGVEYAKAIEVFDNATTLNSEFFLAWNNKGNAFLQLRKYSKAIEAFDKAHNINSNYHLALHNKGNALYSLGKYDEAIELYEQVTGERNSQGNDKPINTVSYKSYNNKGLALYKLERYDEAIKAFDKAIEVNPNFADAWSNKGVVFYKLDIKSEAKKSFKTALEIEPENASASNNLGVVFSWYGEFDLAKKLFEHTIQENYDYVLGHANLAELFLNNGSIEKASKKMEEALDLVNDNIDDDISLAYVYCLDGRIKIEGQSKDKNGKYSEAVESFEKATSYNVEDPTLLLWLVYGKYLCKKHKIEGKDKNGDESNKDQSDKTEKASEESEPNSENTSSETSEKNLKEYFLSIIADLERVLHFCNRPAIKRNSLSESINQNNLMQISLSMCSIFIILLTIFLISEVGLFDLISEFFEWIWSLVQNLMSTIILFTLVLLILFLLISVFLLVRLIVKDFKKADLKVLEKEIPLLYSPAMKIFFFESIFERIKSALKSMVSNTIDVEQSTTSTDSESESVIKINTQLAKFNDHKDIKAYVLYLLGYFYYKLQDYNTAKEKLQECMKLRSGTKTDKAAKNLLTNIWKHEIKPPFWTYWFNSPVKTWKRRSFGFLISLGILLLLFVHPENSIPATLDEYTWNITDGEQKTGGLKHIILPTNNSSLNILCPVQLNIYSSTILYDSNIDNSSNTTAFLTNNTALNILNLVEMDIHNLNIFYDKNIKNLSDGVFPTNNSTSNILGPIQVNIYSSTINVNTSSNTTDSPANNTALNILVPIQLDISPSKSSPYPNNTTSSNAMISPINNTTLNILGYTRMNIHSSKILDSSDDTSAPANNTTLNLLFPTEVNIYPHIPLDNAFVGILLLILILILISPSIRIKDTLDITFGREVAGSTINLTTKIEAPPEFDFELSPSLMQDVIKKLDENL